MVVLRCRLLVLVISALSARGPVVVVVLRFGIFGGCNCKGEMFAKRNVIPKSSEYWEREGEQRRASYRTSCLEAGSVGFLFYRERGSMKMHGLNRMNLEDFVWCGDGGVKKRAPVCWEVGMP